MPRRDTGRVRTLNLHENILWIYCENTKCSAPCPPHISWLIWHALTSEEREIILFEVAPLNQIRDHSSGGALELKCTNKTQSNHSLTKGETGEKRRRQARKGNRICIWMEERQECTKIQDNFLCQYPVLFCPGFWRSSVCCVVLEV